MLFMTVAGYRRNAACCQLAMSVRIQVSPMTVVSLIQIRSNGTGEVLVADRPAPWGQMKLISVIHSHNNEQQLSV